MTVPGWISYLAGRQSGETADARDDFFDGASAVSWSTLTVTGGQTITEQYGKLSIDITSAQTASDVNAYLQAITPSVVHSIEVRCTGLASNAGASDFLMMGLVWSDGATSGSNAACLMLHQDTTTGLRYVTGRAGSFTAMGGGSGPNSTVRVPLADIYLKWEYDAANTFRGFVSPDGVTWQDLGTMSDTVTPTHVGLFWSTWGDAVDISTVSYDYFRYNT